MTPDAVIYRYLEVIAASEIDLEKLCCLLGADADLLARWLMLLGCDAQPEALKTALQQLSAEELTGLAPAQAWSVLPIVGSARLSMEQWVSVLRSACLAQCLTQYLESRSSHETLSTPEHVRWRVLLAVSGVKIPQDERLNELIEYRGTNPVLLEDAALELRIFAVVDAVEVGRESELAQQLLQIDAASLQELMSSADNLTTDLIREIGVSLDNEVDWAQRIWLRQQVGIVAEAFSACSDLPSLHAAHEMASRTLFGHTPLLFLLRESQGVLALPATDLQIAMGSQVSQLAAALRHQNLTTLLDGADLAVVDRQALKALKAEEALIAPVKHNDQPYGLVLIRTDEDADRSMTAQLYSDALANQIERLTNRSGQLPSGNGVEHQLEKFKDAEQQRLREIVHEANNPLSIVHNYLHILELRLQQEPDLVEQLTLISNELRRAGEVFSSARDIPQQVEQSLSNSDASVELELGQFLQDLVELHRGYAAEHGAQLQSQLSDQPLWVKSEQDKMTQIVVNLLKNAIEACAGETVTVAARDGVYRDGLAGSELSVADTGPGLPEEVLASLSAQKVSTKGGDHQGLGLALVYRLTTELGGSLDVRTLQGEGTTFTLFLPA